jgi:hypothetical protein
MRKLGSHLLRFPVSWTATESVPSDERRLKAVVPDIELSVNQLPKGAHKIVDITLEVAADEAGHIMFCLELPRDAKDPRRPFPELVPIACDQAKKSLLLRPPLDPSGKPCIRCKLRLFACHPITDNVRNGSKVGGLVAISCKPLLAQLDRVPGFEPGGWGFKSLGAGQHQRQVWGGKLTNWQGLVASNRPLDPGGHPQSSEDDNDQPQWNTDAH